METVDVHALFRDLAERAWLTEGERREAMDALGCALTLQAAGREPRVGPETIFTQLLSRVPLSPRVAAAYRHRFRVALEEG